MLQKSEHEQQDRQEVLHGWNFRQRYVFFLHSIGYSASQLTKLRRDSSPSILEGVAVGRGSNMKNRKSPCEIISNFHVHNYQ